ncbi:hypothetical protein BDP27DRAFT_346164 [Rhodocollybia butyracea]|uniref:Uncharacterized protein n=1 Tax=Rhodocollybia butyracea TaxID=206335 RepID=A0A9P5UG97_9AGAR|nr:hypothetical protein BDP27DRAFT_346164 [Rhodocollybia butyracea]
MNPLAHLLRLSAFYLGISLVGAFLCCIFFLSWSWRRFLAVRISKFQYTSPDSVRYQLRSVAPAVPHWDRAGYPFLPFQLHSTAATQKY